MADTTNFQSCSMCQCYVLQKQQHARTDSYCFMTLSGIVRRGLKSNLRSGCRDNLMASKRRHVA